MASKKTNLITGLFFIAFILGMGMGAWGLIKEDCIGGPGCWVGSGFLKIAGVVLIIGGLFGMYKSTWGAPRK